MITGLCSNSNLNCLASVSDDKQLVVWDTKGQALSQFGSYSLNAYPTCVEFIKDSIIVGLSDGNICFSNRGGNIEKTFEAHKGAVIGVQTSNDSTCFLSHGEDGSVKIWSKSGSLRSQLVTSDKPVYTAVWGGDDNTVIWGYNKNVSVKTTQSSAKVLSFKAHEGIVSNLDYNKTYALLASSGEDRQFKIWDSYNRLVYQSHPHNFVITSLKFNPTGELLAVGLFETLKVCDKTGWTHCVSKVNHGSVLSLRWNRDSNSVFCGFGDGIVDSVQIMEKTVSNDAFQVTQVSNKKLSVTDIIHEIQEDLELDQPVATFEFAYNHFLVCTESQLRVYEQSNWGHFTKVELKEPVNFLFCSSSYFGYVGFSEGIYIYSYDGKFLSSPKYSGMRIDVMNRTHVALSNDVVILLDSSNHKVLRVFDIKDASQITTIEHSMEICRFELNQVATSYDRKVAIIDSNKDCWMTQLHKNEWVKVNSMVDSLLWNAQWDILSLISDNQFIAYAYPNLAFLDSALFYLASTVQKMHSVDKGCEVVQFNKERVHLRRQDGATVYLSCSQYVILLWDLCMKGQWTNAIKICRMINEKHLWATIAGMGLSAKELEPVEIAFSELDELDKVEWIAHLKQIGNPVEREAELLLYFKKYAESENLLIKDKQYFRLIKNNVKFYRWERALELAKKYNVWVDLVVAYRQRYLKDMNFSETIPAFQNTEVTYDWKTLKDKMKKAKGK